MASRDIESPPLYHASLLPSDPVDADPPQRKLALLPIALTATLLLALAAGLVYLGTSNPILIDRGLKEGVSAKSSAANQLGAASSSGAYAWTNVMLSWQRTGFHFQPQRNWMNDPNGPMYYNGWYHFFYQYNPDAAVWGNIAWGHAVSKDLLNWMHLPLALLPDRKYDEDGVWSGSATVLPDGRVIMLYTGRFNGTVQVQNVAVPANLSDPLLLQWTKIDDINPVMVPPPGIGLEDFRDPSTAWFEPLDSSWRIAIGSKDASNNSMAFVYSTQNFRTYTLLPGTLHTVDRVGMWECIDFYPIATAGARANYGLNTSECPGPQVKHVLKASTSDNHGDYYSVGTYIPSHNTWVPDDVALDVGLGLRYDYGNFYASKTFYDRVKGRRVLWGWVEETDSNDTDKAKGWASLQGIPRSVLFDLKTRTHLLTWPVDEVETLRTTFSDFSSLAMAPGSSYPLLIGGAAQLDIEAEFEIGIEALEKVAEPGAPYDCNSSAGAAHRGMLGPFGLLLLVNQDMTEQTATYFYVAKGKNGNLHTHFCQDELRSSKASDIVKKVVGGTVPVLEGEAFVDHSIIESFAQGGRASTTSRVYPTEAIYDSARVYLFNNATDATIMAKSLKIWRMNSVKTTSFDPFNP